jgi:REP element-mobilizing transposase RayT
LFGDIVNGEMVLNDAGIIAQKYWLEIPSHFPHVELDEYIIMPNHVHGIICMAGVGNFSPLQPESLV